MMGIEQIVLVGLPHHAVWCVDRAAAFLHDESGQDLIEYGLVATLLSLCAIVSLDKVCAGVVALLSSVSTGLSNAI